MYNDNYRYERYFNFDEKILLWARGLNNRLIFLGEH